MNNSQKEFSVLCWNIGNPSEERAGKQAAWLLRRPQDVLVLTEVKASKGCFLIKKYLEAMGYRVVFSISKANVNEYGVMIISKKPIDITDFANRIQYIPTRVASVRVNMLEIIGVYIPSRGSQEGSMLLKKKQFVEELSNAFSSPVKNRIFCGDFNIVEPTHIPRYNHFQDWEYKFYTNLAKYNLRDAFRYAHPTEQEYSWFDHSGGGYRCDHCFVSNDLVGRIKECNYLHEPRESGLSDHSAMILSLEM